jgi:hypothetical protein
MPKVLDMDAVPKRIEVMTQLQGFIGVATP